jgi:hypothetical protein
MVNPISLSHTHITHYDTHDTLPHIDTTTFWLNVVILFK